MIQQTIQTPLAKLLADKERIRQQSRLQEQKLNESISYLQDNAGSLLLSGLSSLFLSGSTPAKKNKALMLPGHSSQATITPIPSFGLADFWSLGKMMIPVVWEIAQPLLITWCIRKVKKVFTGKQRKGTTQVLPAKK